MTTSTTTHPAAWHSVPPRVTSRTGLALVGASTALVAICWSFYGAHHWGEIAFTSAVAVLVAAAVYGALVPWALRREHAGGTALAVSVLAVLITWPAFWSGLPFVLGIAGIVLGHAGRSARRGAGLSIVGLALGALAAAGYLAIFILDGIVAGNAGFLFD